jgi:hypothetical protein
MHLTAMNLTSAVHVIYVHGCNVLDVIGNYRGITMGFSEAYRVQGL